MPISGLIAFKVNAYLMQLEKEMKQCARCMKYKDDEEFNWRWTGIRRQSICRECQRDSRREHYERYTEQEKKRAQVRKKGAVEEAQKFIYGYLSNSVCADCGEYNFSYLTFDHVRGKKKMEISQMVAQGYSIDAIKREILKCDVVCFNHHMEREAKRRSGGRFRKFWPKFPGEE
jgi:hypothetical protein